MCTSLLKPLLLWQWLKLYMVVLAHYHNVSYYCCLGLMHTACLLKGHNFQMQQVSNHVQDKLLLLEEEITLCLLVEKSSMSKQTQGNWLKKCKNKLCTPSNNKNAGLQKKRSILCVQRNESAHTSTCSEDVRSGKWVGLTSFLRYHELRSCRDFAGPKFLKPIFQSICPLCVFAQDEIFLWGLGWTTCPTLQ